MSGDGNRLEEWKKAGECRDFPQPWSDYLWSLEFEHRPDDAKAFHSVAKAVCEQCPVRAERQQRRLRARRTGQPSRPT